MILEIIALIIVLLIILIIIFLFIGLNIKIKLNKNENEFKGYIEIKWLFIKIFSKKFPESESEDNKEDNKESNKESSKENNKKDNKDKKEDIDLNEEGDKDKKFEWDEFKSLISLFRKNLDNIFNFLIVCIQSIKLENFHADIKIGFSSYVDTVNLVGRIWAFAAVPNLSNRFNLHAEPLFTKKTVDFQSEISFKLKLLKPAIEFLKLLTKRGMIKLILRSRRFFNNA